MAELGDRLFASPWLTRFMAILAVGACMNLAGLGVALFEIRTQANEGQKARRTQCEREPVMEKVIHVAASPLLPRRYRLSPVDVKHFTQTAPRCASQNP